MENLPQEQRKQRLIQSKPSEKGEIITYLSQMGDVLDDIQEWGEIAFLRACAVHTVVDGNEPNVCLRENHFRIVSDLEIVAAQTAHILDDDRSDLSILDQCHQARPIRPIEVRTAVPVIHEKLCGRKPVVIGILLQNGLLRRDLSRWFSAKEYQKSNGAATRHLYGSPSTI